MKAILFDLNGIFIKSEPLSVRFERDFGVKKEEFVSVLSSIMEITRLPKAPSVYSLFLPHLDKWGVKKTEEEFLSYWFQAEKIDMEMLGIAKELREKGFRLFIISNGFRERGEYYKKNFSFLGESLGDIFEKIYFSYNTGYKKPDPKFFELILTENNLDPKECLYFDDSEKNILSAKTLGINGIVFKDNNSVKEAIKDF